MIQVPTRYLIGTTRCYWKGGLSLEKISEVEYSSYEALGLFTIFEYNESVIKDPISIKFGSVDFVDLYDPNIYEVIEHKGRNLIVERTDRRFLVKDI